VLVVVFVWFLFVAVLCCFCGIGFVFWWYVLAVSLFVIFALVAVFVREGFVRWG